MSDTTTVMVTQRQNPLQRRYREKPDQAQIADHARAASIGSDPFHGTVVVGDSHAPFDFGIHRAIGGDHDLPNPGDMLCAALAACLDSTIRIIAARMGVALRSIDVGVNAFADVRGCLMVDRQVPVGFQRIDVDVLVKAGDGTDPAQIGKLTSAAEQSCVVLRTLRSDIPVETRFRGATAETPAG